MGFFVESNDLVAFQKLWTPLWRFFSPNLRTCFQASWPRCNGESLRPGDTLEQETHCKLWEYLGFVWMGTRRFFESCKTFYLFLEDDL